MPLSKATRAANQEKRRIKREREYLKRLRQLKKVGAYNPEEEELTPYRRGVINKRYAEFEQYLDKSKYFFIPVQNKYRLQWEKRLVGEMNAEDLRTLKTAKALKMKTTQTGLFYEKVGSRRAKLRKSLTHPGELEIHITGRTKWGINRGKRLDYAVPIATVDAIMLEKERFRNAAKTFGKLKKGETLAFMVISDGVEGYSKDIFGSVDKLIANLETYEKNTAMKLAFFRHVVIVKTTPLEWRQRKKDQKAEREANRSQRRKRTKYERATGR